MIALATAFAPTASLLSSLPTVTTLPYAHLERRHYYTCGPSTLSWEAQWYTEAWYSVSASSYDREASRGPVDPPLSVLVGATECRDPSITTPHHSSLSSVLGGASTSQVVFTTTGADGTVITSTSLTTLSVAPTSASLSSGSQSQVPPTTTAGTASQTSAATASVTSQSISPTASAPPTQGEENDGISRNTCAGGWDYQAWAAVSASVVGVLVGGIMWAAWAMLRGRMPELFSPRAWYTSTPPSKWSWAAFLLPFLNLPSSTSGPQSPAGGSLAPLFASLKLASLTSLLALSAGLPLFIANVPCLGLTSPPNNLGGRLGTLTDLSVLRLLNALDPSPGSPSTPSAIRLLLSQRALSSTIGSAIPNARVRLIVVLVLIGLLSLVGGLWVVSRTYAGIAKYRQHFQKVVCGGMEMVILPSSAAPGLEGLSEEKVKKKLRELSRSEGPDDAPELEIVGVFAIPDITELRQRISDRDNLLTALETAEADYITAYATEGGHRTGVLGDIPHTSSGDLAVPLPPTVQMAATRTRFHEINRNSTLFGRGQKFEIGQAIKIAPDGRYVRDRSPSSAGTRTGEEAEESGESGEAGRTPNFAESAARPESPTKDSPVVVAPNETRAYLRPGPAHHPEIISPATFPSAHASTQRSASPGIPASPTLIHPNSAIQRLRGQLQTANQEVLGLQQAAWGNAAIGGKVDGWVIAGRGVQWLVGEVLVEGRTREDILWHNVGQKNGERVFVVSMSVVGVLLALLLVPFIGLSNAAAPGFAHYLPFLEPLAQNDGLGAGIAGGLVPATALFLIAAAAVASSELLSKKMSCVSASRKRALQYKAVFWILFGVVILWSLLVSALQFAVQGLTSGVQESRTVGDGAIFSTWWTFVFLLNIALIVPAIYILQPKRLLASLRASRGSMTPRERFRLYAPRSFNPAYYLAAPLLCVFYAETLLFFFPLLAIPAFLLLYLSFIAIRHMREYVFVDSAYSDGTLALWTIRRLGWGLALTPVLFGLVLLSRNEWTIGGVAIGVGTLAGVAAECLTARRYPAIRLQQLSAGTRRKLDLMGRWVQATDDSGNSDAKAKRGSNRSSVSVLQRVAALLPGYSRLPDICPLPLGTEVIDDRMQTERAAHTRADLPSQGTNGESQGEGEAYFRDPTKENHGLIYPTEMLLRTPVVWLPYDTAGVARKEAEDLEGVWGLPAIVDPPPREPLSNEERGHKRRNTLGQAERRAKGNVGNPLLG